MKTSGLSTVSRFGKFYTKDQTANKQNKIVKLVELKQNFSHERPLIFCKFSMAGNRIYLLDQSGTLIGLNLKDNTISTLKNENIIHVSIDVNNPYDILLVNKKSELFRTHFQSKKTTKLMNLNLSRILAFQKNHLRQLLLVLDYKILMTYDLTNPNKIKSLKADHDQIFTNASFASNNRFLILAVKNIQIRVIEIMNFKTLHKIRLPFQIQQLKIEISYNSKKISIYGKCHIIFFISFNEKMQLSYQLVQLPHVKAIRQLKYTYQDQIIFLANDQIIYAIGLDNLNKLVPIFNAQQKIRLTCFDLSLDNNSIIVISNRTVFNVFWKGGLRKTIRNSTIFKQIELIDNLHQNKICEVQKINNKNYQYDQEEQQQQQIQKCSQNQELRLNSGVENIIQNQIKKQQILERYNQYAQNNKNKIVKMDRMGYKQLNIENKQSNLQALILKQEKIRKDLMNLYLRKDII